MALIFAKFAELCRAKHVREDLFPDANRLVFQCFLQRIWANQRGDEEAAVGLIWNQHTVIMMHFCLTEWYVPHVSQWAQNCGSLWRQCIPQQTQPVLTSTQHTGIVLFATVSWWWGWPPTGSQSANKCLLKAHYWVIYSPVQFVDKVPGLWSVVDCSHPCLHITCSLVNLLCDSFFRMA